MSFHRRHGRFDGDGEEFATVCPLAAGVARLAGVHFECRFTAVVIVLAVAWRNLSPYARWPQSFFALPACIFFSFHRRRNRFDGDGEEFVAVCPLVAAVLRLAGVHF